MATEKAIARSGLLHAGFSAATNAAILTAPDCILFIAPCKCELVRVDAAFTVASGDAGAVTLDLKKAANGVVPGSGVGMLAAVADLKGTPNTVAKRSVSNAGLSTVAGATSCAEGDRVCLDFTGTPTGLTGLRVDAYFRPRGSIAF